MAMLTTASALGVMGEAGLYLPQFQPAGARIGPFSNANYMVDATLGQGPEWQNNRSFGLRTWRSATNNNQGLWRFGTGALTGWGIISGNTRDTRLFFRPSAASTIIWGSTFRQLLDLVLTVDGGGNIRGSANGSPAFAVAAPAAYVAAGAGAVHSIGKWQSEAAFPAVGTSMLQNYVIDAHLSDTELQYYSGAANRLDRWHPVPEVLAHPNLLWFCNWENWNGTDPTFAGVGNGGGPSPYVMTVTGTGGGRTVLPAYLRYRIPNTAVFANGFSVPYELGTTRRSIFSFAEFTSDAADTTAGPAGLVVEQYGKLLGVVANAESGVQVNGAQIQGNNILAEMDQFDVLRACDVTGILAGAAKTFRLTIEGLQSRSGAVILPNASAQFVRVPAATPLIWSSNAAPPADVSINMFESLACQVDGINGTAGIKGPPVDAWPMLERNAIARRVANLGWGFGTWHEFINTSALRTQTLAWLRAIAIGTTSNWFWLALGTNDYGLNTYVLLATFEADLVAFINGILGLGLPDTRIQVVSPTTRTNEAVNNASGWNLPNMRTAQSNVVATVADTQVTYVDGAAFVSAGNRPDGLHYNPAGHIEYNNARAANPPPVP